MDDSSLDAYLDGSTYQRETVRFYDVAHEGAQVRAVAGAIERMEGLYRLQPRSLVVLATDQVAAAAARVVVRMRAPLRVPVVVTDTLPSYVGALDIVMVVGDRADDPDTSRGLIAADRRGATTLLVGPPRGPILEDAPAGTVIIPALPTAAGASPARTIIAVATVLDLLEEDPDLVAQRLEDIAGRIDEELEQLSPERDVVVNPGRQLRGYADMARVVHTGRSRHGFAVAELMSVLWSQKGLPSGVVAWDELEFAPQAPVRDVFHDPFLDGPVDLVPLRTVVWAEDPDVAAALPDALAVTCETPGIGELAAALQLITRGLAATTYDLPDAPTEDY
ncbi:hypothetical protein [Corynebacterium sp.]|uniref:hypothetical protein n=1 Tax=Corynebacterium sp. TaxID=1720 RepID=UPI0026DFF95A|nr:hypothetical protein [Corynebacterium sp.]MDO5511654.1 hypothetical protein [Corynebacterium sp.]